jgi:YD repeat-containing protein
LLLAGGILLPTTLPPDKAPTVNPTDLFTITPPVITPTLAFIPTSREPTSSRPLNIKVSEETYLRIPLPSGEQVGTDSGISQVIADHQLTYVVSGNSLHEAVQFIGGMTHIDGAAYNPATRRLAIVGHSEAGWPALNPDDLVIALRGVLEGDDQFGVTINPTPEQAAQGATRRDGPEKMPVLYFGQTKDTHMGLGLFRADRFLKDLSIGLDEQGKPVTSHVVGYASELQLMAKLGTGGNGQWRRMWFVPQEINVSVASNGQSMWIDSLRMQADSRYVQFVNGQMQDVPGNNPAAQAFTDFLTRHYTEFAKENPSLAEIVQFDQMITLARWIRDYRIPVAFDGLNTYPFEPVQTPSDTLCYLAEMVTGDGSLSLFGGVDLSPQPSYRQSTPGGMAEKLSQVMSSAGLPAGSLTASQVGDWVGLVLPLDAALPPSVGAPSFRQPILSSTLREPSLAMAWQYSPKDAFLGWRVALASASLSDTLNSDPNTQPQYSQVNLVDLKRAREKSFSFVKDKDGIHLKSSLDHSTYFYPSTDDGHSLTYQPANGYYTWQQPDATLIFDRAGKLISEEEGGKLTQYIWDAQGRLVSVQSNNGALVQLKYTDQEVQVISAGQSQTVRRQGQSIVFDESQGQTVYTYQDDRIQKITYPDGSTQALQYNDRGRVTSSTRQWPDSSLRLNIEYSKITGTGVITRLEVKPLAYGADVQRGVDLAALEKMGVKELVLTQRPLDALIFDQGKVIVAQKYAAKTLERLKLIAPQMNASPAKRVAVSLEDDVVAVWDAQARQVNVSASGKTWTIDKIQSISDDDLGRITAAVAAQRAGARTVLALKQDGQTSSIWSPELRDSVKIDPENWKKITEASGITPYQTLMELSEFQEIQNQIGNSGPGDSPIYVDGPPELAYVLNQLWPAILVSVFRTPKESYLATRDGLKFDPQKVVIFIAKDWAEDQTEDQAAAKQKKSLKEILVNRLGEKRVRVVENEADRQQILAQLASEDLTVLELAHSPDGETIQMTPYLSLRAGEIKAVAADTILLSCSTGSGRLAEKLLESGGRSVIAPSGPIQSDYAAQWLQAFADSVNKKTEKISLLDILMEIENRLRITQGKEYKGRFLMPISLGEKLEDEG